MPEDDGKYHYITPEHEHRSGQVGRDLYSTDRPATLSNDTAREIGLPKAREIGSKDHLIKGEDY
jgi:hypothetical protein